MWFILTNVSYFQLHSLCLQNHYRHEWTAYEISINMCLLELLGVILDRTYNKQSLRVSKDVLRARCDRKRSGA